MPWNIAMMAVWNNSGGIYGESFDLALGRGHCDDCKPDHGHRSGRQERVCSNVVISAFIPIYGMIYFFAANKNTAPG
jgi:hypothetical protein